MLSFEFEVSLVYRAKCGFNVKKKQIKKARKHTDFLKFILKRKQSICCFCAEVMLSRALAMVGLRGRVSGPAAAGVWA